VSWFSRRKPSVAGGRGRAKEDQAYLEEFVRAKRGVEGFIEPRTTVTETTLLLVAHDGEWTRRRVPSPQDARRFAHRLSMPIYDIALVGYPKRMRDYNERRKKEGLD
jgi:hypothetical protein